MRKFSLFLNKFASKIIKEINKSYKPTHKIDFETTEVKEQLKKFIGHYETKTIVSDYQQAIHNIFNPEKLQFINSEAGKKIVEEQEEKNRQDQQMIINAESESQKIVGNFFNDFSLNILKNSRTSDLLNAACKSYVGDIDVPKDPVRSSLLLQLAEIKSESDTEKNDIQFYRDYFHEEQDDKLIIELKKAKQANDVRKQFISARNIFKGMFFNFKHDQMEAMPEDQKTWLYSELFFIFESAAKYGIYEGNYFLGVMYLNGLYVPLNKRKAYYYFCLAASHSHALAYYELFKILKNDIINIYTDDEIVLKKEAMFDYLKIAAEEGYVEAMHELGNEYAKGELCKKNYEQALAWYRCSSKNGNILSYESSGDIYYSGGYGIKANMTLSFVMYYCGLMKGIDLKNKCNLVREELIRSGEPLPEMIKEYQP